MATHWVVVRVEAPEGVTTQAVIEEIASNLQSVDDLQLEPMGNVVAAVVDPHDSVEGSLRRRTVLVTW